MRTRRARSRTVGSPNIDGYFGRNREYLPQPVPFSPKIYDARSKHPQFSYFRSSNSCPAHRELCRSVYRIRPGYRLAFCMNQEGRRSMCFFVFAESTSCACIRFLGDTPAPSPANLDRRGGRGENRGRGGMTCGFNSRSVSITNKLSVSRRVCMTVDKQAEPTARPSVCQTEESAATSPSDI